LIDLVKAFGSLAADHTEWTLLLAGRGPAEAGLREVAKRLGIADRVSFLGHFDFENRQALLRLYRDAGVYVQPSHYEGLPTALLEAMAAGTPCVATAVSGHLDVITSGANGLLVPPADPASLARALRTLMQDPCRAAQMASRARQSVLASYTWRSLAERYVTIYEQAVATRAKEIPQYR
jgi:glycosyltransferase involved in cell wall biosynthesis